MTLSMFLESDQQRAGNELEQYNYLMTNALSLMAQGEFRKAAIYHQNIVQSLESLQELRNTKQQIDLALKRIQGDREMIDLLRKLGVVE